MAGTDGRDEAASPARRRPLLALILLVPSQGIGVWAMLFALPGAEGKVVSAITRLWMLGLPLAWTLLVDRGRPRIEGPRRRGLVVGVVSGLAIFAVILATYALSGPILDAEQLRSRARSTGFDRPVPFALISAYILLVNPLLEEYVWRWFVYRQVEAILPVGIGRWGRRLVAVVVAAVLFSIHHVIALAAWVGPAMVLLGTLGVFLGAVVWSAIYARERSLWPCYVSHVLADLAILMVGYDVVFRSG